MHITIDRQANNLTSQRTYTDERYLRVPGRVARTGVQQYLAGELGLQDRAANEVVNVYRPPEEVFAPESLKSYKDKDITNDHPQSMVNADSFKELSVGHTTDAARPEDDQYVVVDLILKDADAIKKVEDGKAALSAGYEAQYHYEPGYTEDGTPYEYVQRNIRINHVALVDKARAGPGAKLYDNKPKYDHGGNQMSIVTLDGGKTVEVQDNATAQLIQSTLDANKKSYEDMEKKAKEMEDEAQRLRDEMEKMKAEKDSMSEELEKKKKEASDEALSERLQTVVQVKDDAAKIAGSDFTSDSVDPMQIKRDALAKARPTVDWSDKSDAYVTAAWDMAKEQAENDPGKASHDRMAEDLKKLYQTDTGQMLGSAEYQKFLNGGK